MPVWLKEKFYLKSTLKKELAALGGLPRQGERERLLQRRHSTE
jgi:hypothetical protein